MEGTEFAELKEGNKKKKKKFKALRIFGKILLGLFVFVILLLLFIRSPWGQDIIIDKVISSVSQKTGTSIKLERAFVSFSGDINIDGLYIEDLSGDTLLYSKSLEADIPIWPIITGAGISVNSVDWNGVTAHITRRDSISGFNYQFLVDAYASADTTSAPQDTSAVQLSLGKVSFNNFDVAYNDAVSGMKAALKLGEFNLEMEELDLEKMRFHIADVNLTNAGITYSQTKPMPESEDTTATAMPTVVVDNLQLNNVNANYESVPDGMLAKIILGTFLLKMPKANLAENNIVVDFLRLKDSDVLVKTTTLEEERQENRVENRDTLSEEKPQGFEWPDWKVKVNEIFLENNDIAYLVDGQEPKKGTFNPDAIAIKNVCLQLNDLYLRNQKAGLSLEKLSFTEAGGINFKDAALNLKIENESLSIDNLLLAINENHLEGKMAMEYTSIDQLMENPQNASINLSVPKLVLSINDAFLFRPDLKNNEYVQALSTNTITGNLKLNGTLSHLKIPQFNLNWGQNTSINARGAVKNPMETENIQFDFPQFDFVSTKAALSNFVHEDSLGVSIPEKIRLASSFHGNPENITATAALVVPEGKINVTGNFLNQEEIAFDANLEVMEFDLGKVLQNPQLGKISLTLETSGQGSNINNLDADLNSEITSFSYNGYQFENLNITGELENGSGPITLDYKDDNLDMAMETLVSLDSVSSRFDVAFKMEGADLQALGLSPRAIKTSFKLNALFEGNAEAFDLNSQIVDGIVVYDNKSFLLGNVDLLAHVRPDTTSVVVTNKMMDLELQSNASPAAFANALQQHLFSYLTEEIEPPDTLTSPVQLRLRANISPAPVLTDVLLPGLKRLDTVDVSVDFEQASKKLDAMVSLPFMNYNGNEIDSLEVLVNSDRDNFKGSLSFNAINSGPIAMNRTRLTGNIANDRLNLDFESYAQDSLLVNVQSTLNAENDSLYFHIDPSELLLNGNAWNIPENNRMVLAKDFIAFENFELNRNNQEALLISKDSKNPKENISISFENFELASVLGFLNPENSLATGALNGNLVIEEPFGNTGTLAKLEINEFHVMDVPLGNLSLDAAAEGNKKYTFDLALNDGGIDMDLTGSYTAKDVVAALDLNLALNELKLAAVEKFTDGAITNTGGYVSGNLEINGTTAKPIYEGQFQFHDANFTVATLNAPFSISNEVIKVDTTAVYFDDFKILDENNSGIVIDGRIITQSFTNPAFDLALTANDFQMLHSTAEDNDLFYGTAIFNAKASLKGDLNLPIINMSIDVHPKTNFTYIIPESELAVVKRDGVVVFVNKEDPNNILTRNTEEEEMAAFSGMIVDVIINIKEGAAFNVIIDEETGDNLRVLGEGTLNFSISETGRTNLAGKYELSGGHYEMNLYGLVNRKFEIVPGSSISWFGDMFDASLDISAIYRVETSASALMAAQISGSDASTQNRFRRKLPFLVYLNVDGRLMKPKLSFGIGMPEDEQGSMGGKVYARVQQLNEQESELNKQVFSLLVLNRFYPQSNSYGGEGGALTIARDNLNQAISDQLNMFSDELLKDTSVALNFGLDSYTDYQGESPQERTALEISAEKHFFGDRLIVEVGSEVNLQGSDPSTARSNPLIGNVSIQYLLTENGRYRLKAFRKNTFENIIDGQVIISGIALIFQREFNEFKELWANPKEEAANVEKEKQ